MRAWIISCYGAAMMLTGAALSLSPGPGQWNALDNAAASLAASGHASLASLAWRVSAAMLHSTHARMRLGEELTRSGRLSEAWDYYFPAVYARPELGVEAALATLRHARTERDYGMAAGYLEWAIRSSRAAEARRLRARLVLASELPAGELMRRALREYRAAADLGDGEGRLVTGLALWLGAGVSRDRAAGYAWLILAVRGENGAARLAREAIASGEDGMRRMLERILNQARRDPAATLSAGFRSGMDAARARAWGGSPFVAPLRFFGGRA